MHEVAPKVSPSWAEHRSDKVAKTHTQTHQLNILNHSFVFIYHLESHWGVGVWKWRSKENGGVVHPLFGFIIFLIYFTYAQQIGWLGFVRVVVACRFACKLPCHTLLYTAHAYPHPKAWKLTIEPLQLMMMMIGQTGPSSWWRWWMWFRPGRRPANVTCILVTSPARRKLTAGQMDGQNHIFSRKAVRKFHI